MVGTYTREGYFLSREQAAQISLSSDLYLSRPSNSKPYDLWVLPGCSRWSMLAEAVDGWAMADIHSISPQDRAASWRQFIAHSMSISVFRHTAQPTNKYQPVATLRWTRGEKPEQLRGVHFFREGWGESALLAVQAKYQLDWTRTWSIDTLAVDQSTLRGVAAGLQVWSALLKTLYDLVFANDVGWLIGIMEEGTYTNLCGIVPGIEPIGPKKHFLHGQSVPFILDIRTLQQKLDESPFADMFRHGKGIGGLMLNDIFNFPDAITR